MITRKTAAKLIRIYSVVALAIAAFYAYGMVAGDSERVGGILNAERGSLILASWFVGPALLWIVVSFAIARSVDAGTSSGKYFGIFAAVMNLPVFPVGTIFAVPILIGLTKGWNNPVVPEQRAS